MNGDQIEPNICGEEEIRVDNVDYKFSVQLLLLSPPGPLYFNLKPSLSNQAVIFEKVLCERY